jgi:hypothetical protein
VSQFAFLSRERSAVFDAATRAEHAVLDRVLKSAAA